MTKFHGIFIVRKISIVLLIIIHFSSFSQNEILVPFRVGDKFGLSDLKGKLVYPAEFEYFKTNELGSYEASFEGVKEGRSTFFYKGKKIVERTKKTKYKVIRESFITVSEENKGFEIFNFNGEQITDKSYVEMIFCDNLLQRNFYYTCTPIIFKDQNDKLTLQVFNAKTEKFTKTFVENVSSLILDPYDNLYKNRFTIFVQENINSKEVKLEFVFDGDSFVILDPTNYFKKNIQNNPKKGKPIILEENENGNMENYNEFGVQAPVGAYRETDEYQDYSKSGRILKKIDGLCLTIIQKNDKTSKEKEFELPQNLDARSFQNVNMKLVINKVKYYLDDLVLYKSNGKYGVVLTKEYYLSPKYDSIRLLVLNKNSSNPNYYFQVGIKDSITNKMKFGLVDLSEKTIFPIVYDVFRNATDNQTGGYKFSLSLPNNAEFIVAKEGKYGIVSLDEVKAPLIYDDIFYLDSKNCVLVKSGLYGIYFQDRMLVNLKMIEPVFTKIPFNINVNAQLPIIELYEAQNTTNEYTDFYKPDILKRTGNFFCYGNVNGMMYYKEK
jgi:hypothetical protein